MNKIRCFGLFLLVFIFPFVADGDVRLPHIFGSHMVLQQGKPINVWGWADAGEPVTVSIAAQQQQTQANAKGEWRVSFPAMKADGVPVTVKVSGKNTLTLDDVLIGEVWLGSGQSNMQMGILGVNNAQQEVAAANYPLIRIFLVDSSINTLPQSDLGGLWKVCRPDTIVQGGWNGFSAAAYFFGRELFKSLNVPVGLIESAWGGTPIESWIPSEGFASSPALESIYDQVQLHDPRTEAHRQKLEAFIAGTEQWTKDARQATQDKTITPAPPAFPPELQALTNQNQPTALYNGMIHPLEQFSMRGVIWYQGEANNLNGDGKIYTDKTRAQVESWRKLFEQPDLAYYYALIAPFNYNPAHPQLLPEFWEAQAAAMAIPNTGMVVTTDIGIPNNIHPTNKQEVGRRFALWALAKTYGKSGIVYSGPTYKSFSVEGNKMRVSFDHAENGLVSRDGNPLSDFEIIDANQGGFVPATATIDGASVLLTADGVTNPAAMRFGWNQTDEPNLSNKDGLPAAPFRAGDFPKRDAFKLLGSETKGYELIYDLDLSKANGTITYDQDLSEQVTRPFDRIAYLLELTEATGDQKYVYVSMNAFTQDARKIGVPTVESHAVFQQNVSNLDVFSNVPGIITGAGIQGGNIEFWPNSYGPANTTAVPNASNDLFDFGDTMTDPVDGYGSMQVHNHDAKQTLFAYNHWKESPKADLGIGNEAGKNPDWTYAANAGNYPAKRLRIYVRYK